MFLSDLTGALDCTDGFFYLEKSSVLDKSHTGGT